VKGRKQKVKGGGPRYSKKQCRDSIAGKVKEKMQIWKEGWNNRTSSIIREADSSGRCKQQ
jgi:hypothetical protein